MADVKIVAIFGGLGSQMFKYATYLMVKAKYNTNCFIDSIPCFYLNQWNGYELEQVFGIDAPDIRKFISEEQLSNLIEREKVCGNVTYRVVKRKWRWSKTWIVFGGIHHRWIYEKRAGFMRSLFKTAKLIIGRINKKTDDKNPSKRAEVESANKYNVTTHIYSDKIWTLQGVVYYHEFGYASDRYFKNIESDIKRAFQFPALADERNIQISQQIQNTESVAVHIRRSDHLYDCINLFNDGYFKNAVKFMKSKTEKPVFYIFSEEMDWCKAHWDEIGLSPEDEAYFIDWNPGNQSYRDMQLMTYCKHNIVGISNFSWWGYYLSQRDNKIVCAPEGIWDEIPYHF